MPSVFPASGCVLHFKSRRTLGVRKTGEIFIVIESLLLAVTRVSTMSAERQLTNATGFFFERDGKLFLITSRHVVLDEASDHRPDRLAIELHIDTENVAAITQWLIPLYRDNQPAWREGIDSGGTVDVAALELDRSALPSTLLFRAFTSAHLVTALEQIEVGTPVLIVGFPLGFHDTLHHLPVARQAVVASAFGMRFQAQGYFLTDARMHRGSSGAPVVARMTTAQSGREVLPWTLLGVHAARMDVTRDIEQEERLDLNCAWYTDIIMKLTDHPALG
jgi:S1-C subfamily serine protease